MALLSMHSLALMLPESLASRRAKQFSSGIDEFAASNWLPVQDVKVFGTGPGNGSGGCGFEQSWFVALVIEVPPRNAYLEAWRSDSEDEDTEEESILSNELVPQVRGKNNVSTSVESNTVVSNVTAPVQTSKP